MCVCVSVCDYMSVCMWCSCNNIMCTICAENFTVCNFTFLQMID